MAHAWLADPLTKTREVVRLENARWSLLGTHRDEARVRAEPFEAIELELAALWARWAFEPQPAPPCCVTAYRVRVETRSGSCRSSA